MTSLLKYLDPQTVFDAVNSILSWDEVPDDALENILGSINADEYSGFCID